LHNTSEFFNDPYFDKRDLDQERFVARKRSLLNLLTDGRTAKDARILDIGCDTGSLLTVARDEFGMVGLGVEVSDRAARIAREEHGLEVLVGQISDLKIPEMSFDFIVMEDVVEHVADPAAFLGKIYQLLRDGGKIYISTVEHDAFVNTIGLVLYRLLGSQVRGLIERRLYVPYHEFYFTKATLAQLVRQSRLQIVHHVKQEFPISEVHGTLPRLVLMPVFALQHLLGRQTLQELVGKRVI